MRQPDQPVSLLHLALCMVLVAVVCPVLATAEEQSDQAGLEAQEAQAEQSGRYTVAPPVDRRSPAQGTSGEWEWTFPDYIGNVGLLGSTFPCFDEANGQIGVFYRHLESVDGPLYMGFRVEPFTMGSVYDEDGYPGLHSWSSALEMTVRFYTDMLVPEFYVEGGLGFQYTRFNTADDLADITENGFSRDSFGRWRGTFRLSIGLEFDVFGIEIGAKAIFTKISMDYTTYIPTDPIHTVDINGSVYFALYFRFDSSN